MNNIFNRALNIISGNDGVVTIVIIFIFSTIITTIFSKTIKLNQKQSYWLLTMVFIGIMLFLIIIYAIFLNSKEYDKDIRNNIELNNSVKDIKDSNLSFGNNLEAKDSLQRIDNSNIKFK